MRESDILIIRGASIVDELFHYTIPNVGDFWWNVTRAKAQVAAGHAITKLTIPLAEMAAIAARNETDPAKVAQADPSNPGIAAPIIWEGKIIYILIDGLHRNRHALELGENFTAHLLSDAAAAACYVGGPAGYMPWERR